MPCFFFIPVCLLVSLNDMISSSFLLIVLFGHPIFLNTFSYFISLIVPRLSFAADFSMFCKFFHFFSMSVSFSFVLSKWSFILWVYSHLMLSLFNNLTLKDSSCFNGAFLLPLFNLLTSGLLA